MTKTKKISFWTGFVLAFALVVVAALWFKVFRAGEATVISPQENTLWMVFRDTQTVAGKDDCVGEQVLEDGPNKGKYKFTCVIVPDHIYYTDHRDVAPGDWIPDPPYIAKNDAASGAGSGD